MNMFKKIKARSVKDYLAALPKARKAVVLYLHAFIKKVAPRLKPHWAYNMLGYGRFPYKNYRQEMISWPIVALANQKHYISVYICAVENGEYLAEKYKTELGKVDVGKSCIRFKKLTDVNLNALKKVIQAAAKKPGLAGAGERRT